MSERRRESEFSALLTRLMMIYWWADDQSPETKAHAELPNGSEITLEVIEGVYHLEMRAPAPTVEPPIRVQGGDLEQVNQALVDAVTARAKTPSNYIAFTINRLMMVFKPYIEAVPALMREAEVAIRRFEAGQIKEPTLEAQLRALSVRAVALRGGDTQGVILNTAKLS